MGSKAKAITGLLAATCICSVIALILSVVNVKDVFLPPSTKVGSSGGVQLSLGCWLPVGCWILPGFQAGCAVCHQHGDKALHRLGWVWLSLVTVPGPTAHTAFSSQSTATSRDLGRILVPSTAGDCSATRLFLSW